MKLKWNVAKDTGEDEITLVYDMFLGTKKLMINNKKIYSLKRDWNKEIKFRLGSDVYRIELIPQGYEYEGFLISPEGNKINNIPEQRIEYKTPWWLILFIIIDMAIPVLSVEALRPWIIGIIASYADKKICGRPDIRNRDKLIISIIISVIAWLAYHIFYFKVKNSGMNGGFLPF